MSEQDKNLKECFEYLNKYKDIKIEESITLNDKIKFSIIQIQPIFVITFGGEMFALGEYAREISFIDDELKIITKKFIKYKIRNYKKRKNF